jgi:predicted ATPase/DNA-binding CsgD family transcriptional regulator
VVAWEEFGVVSPAGLLRPRLTSFVGRESETADVLRLLREHRLVTVTGPGGVGKTRLAVEAAGQAAGKFPDGVRFVQLSGVREGGQVVDQLMAVLGVPEQRGVPSAELLAGAVAARQMLLVLDNCEHVLDAVAEMCGFLLRAADDVRLLATSREQLWAAGEVRYRLSPLRLPASDDPADISESGAVELFAERAMQADPRFSLGDGNAALVSGVVVALDGMPLAIELAAARVEALGMSGLAGLISDAVGLLDGRDRLAAGRHRSLAAVADWSYQLLDGPERRVFRRLAAFPGPFTLKAAEVVAGPGAGSVVLRLVDCSLLVPPRPGADGRMRYSMLETLRAFGGDRLADSGERDDTMAALCGFALSVAEPASADLQTTDREPAALRWLDAEDPTLSAALAWAEGNDRAAALRLAAGLAPWWRMRGRLTEARTRLETSLRHASVVGEGWAAATVLLAHTMSAFGDQTGAQDAIDAVCEPSGGAPLSWWTVDALLARALWAQNNGDFAGCAHDAERALELARDIGHLEWEAPVAAVIGLNAFLNGDMTEALAGVRRVEETLSDRVPGYLARWCAMRQTMVLTDAGEYDWGSRVCDSGITLAREVGDVRALNYLLVAKVRLELLAGRLDDARAGLRQAAEASARIGLPESTRNCVYLGGFLCAASGQWAEAVTLWAAADADSARGGVPNPEQDTYRPYRSDYREQIERALSPAQVRDARQRGTRLSAQQAMELTGILTEQAGPLVPESPEGSGDARLTAREQELVTLVAQGGTNAQIAAQLHISVYTVRSHLDRIRDKTGCRRRSDLTRLALRLGLI